MGVFHAFSLLPWNQSLLFFSCRIAFFKAAYALFDSDFYVKADDDIYLRPGDYIDKAVFQYNSMLSFWYFLGIQLINSH